MKQTCHMGQAWLQSLALSAVAEAWDAKAARCAGQSVVHSQAVSKFVLASTATAPF